MGIAFQSLSKRSMATSSFYSSLRPTYMLMLKATWGFLLLVALGFCENFVANAAITSLSVREGIEVASVQNITTSVLNSTGWGSDSRNKKRDGKLPTALINAFLTSSWIWTTEIDAPNAPILDRAFRSTFTSPTGKVAASALILLSVDDQFSFYVNGNLVGSSPTTQDNWKNATTYSITLAATSNVFAIRGINSPDVNSGGPGPAGVLAAIQITFSDGTTSLLSSSSGWRSIKVIPNDFESPSLDDSQWDPAAVLFKYGEGPWLSDVVIPTDTAPIITLPSSNAGTASPTAPTSTNRSTATPAATGSNSSGTSHTAPLITSPSSNAGTASPTAPTSTNRSTATPAAAGSSSSGTSQPVGAIVGGVIGGIGFLLLIGLVFLWRKKRSRRGPAALSLNPQSHDFELGNRLDPFSDSEIATTQPQNTSQRMTQHAPSPPASSEYFSSIAPSMSASRVNHVVQGANNEGEFRDRIERLEELVLELDREIASGGGGGSRVAELRGGIAELSNQNTGPAVSANGGRPRDNKTRSVAPPAYQPSWD